MNLDALAALPEMVLLAGACVLMLLDVRVKTGHRQTTFVAAQVVLAACAAATAYVWWFFGWDSASVFHGLYLRDAMGHVLKLVSYFATSLALVYSRQWLIDRDLLRGEFITLLLFSLLGMMVLISANSMLTVYLGLELMSLCLYALIALNRDSAVSTEAAMKYFVLGALASGLLLYGMSMIYGATGTLTLNEVGQALAGLVNNTSERPFLVFGLVFVVAGVAFKLGVVPFHMWIPDVYHGAPTPMTLIVGTGPKVAAFAMAMRLLVNGMLELAHDWQQMLAIMALLSMAIGNITAIAQTNLKRMLAYSAIAHMGFVLLGMLSGVVDGNRLSAADAYSTAMFYMVVYVIMTLGSFGMLLYCSRAGFDCERLEDMRGLSRRNPWYAFLMMVLMFSLAGIPPTAGFYAKLAVLSAAVNAGYVWLAVAAVVLSLVGAFYYLRVVKLMYFDEPKEASEVGQGSLVFRVLLSTNGVALVLLGILPQSLMGLCFKALTHL